MSWNWYAFQPCIVLYWSIDSENSNIRENIRCLHILFQITYTWSFLFLMHWGLATPSYISEPDAQSSSRWLAAFSTLSLSLDWCRLIFTRTVLNKIEKSISISTTAHYNVYHLRRVGFSLTSLYINNTCKHIEISPLFLFVFVVYITWLHYFCWWALNQYSSLVYKVSDFLLR